MSQKIIVEVDLTQEDAALKIEEGIETLRLLQPTTMPMYYSNGGRVGEVPKPSTSVKIKPDGEVEINGDVEVSGSIVPAPPAAASDTPAAPAAASDTPAPPAATTETPAAPEGVDVDSEGLPWDGRIHSSAKTKLVKGNTWKIKRGTDPALVEQVKAELKATMAAAPATPAAPEATKEPDPKAVFGEGSDVPELPETPMPFPEILEIVTERLAAGTLQQVDLDTILEGKGIPNIGMLASRPDLISEIAEELEAV